MKRLVNFRAALVAAIAFALGIFAFYELLFGEFYFGLVILALILFLLVFGAFRRNGVWKIAIVALIFLLLGFGRSYWFYAENTSREVFCETLTVTGRVSDFGRNGAKPNNVYYLDGCVDSDGNRLDGKVRVYFVGDANLEVGNNVVVQGVVSSVYAVKGKVSGFYLRNDIRYDVNDAQLISASEGSMHLDELIRKYIYDTVCAYMPNNSSIMYALLTGDRNAMSESEEWAFSRAGIVHLLAVSGLHVGFIAAAISFVLKKFKAPQWLECLIVLIPLVFYAYICSFTPSVVRALIMVVCGYIARMLFSRRDMLSSLSTAALVTLSICPFYLFDMGFQLSFLSVFGIATLHVPFNRFLTRKKVNKYLSKFISAASLSFCCMGATMFVLLANGGDVALFGVFINVIAVPLVSFALALGVFGLLPWVFHYILFVADALLQVVVRFAETIAQASFATVFFKALTISVFVMAALMFVLGGYVNLGKIGKGIFISLCCAAIVVCTVLGYIPRGAENIAYVVYSDDGCIAAVLSEDGNAALVGDFSDYVSVKDAAGYLKNYGSVRLTIYFTHYASADPNAVGAVLDSFEVQKAYLLNTEANVEVGKLFESRDVETIYQYPNSQVGEGVYVRTLFDGELRAVEIVFGKVEMCLAYGAESQILSLLDMGLGAEVYLLPNANDAFSEAGLYTLTPYQSGLPYNYGANKYGNFTITQKGDTIQLNFR